MGAAHRAVLLSPGGEGLPLVAARLDERIALLASVESPAIPKGIRCLGTSGERTAGADAVRVRSSPAYSYRNATEGSTLIAFRAGK
jgi:hypothetical protein